MNQALDTSDVAFGRAVQALQFRRRTLSAELLWSPLPQGWEMNATERLKEAKTLEVPAHVISTRPSHVARRHGDQRSRGNLHFGSARFPGADAFEEIVRPDKSAGKRKYRSGW